MFERFTKQARAVVVGAQEESRGLGHGWVGTEHLLLAVLRQPADPGAATLLRLGVTVESCRAAVAGVVTQDTDTLGPEDAEALRTFGIDLDEIRRRTEETFGPGALDTPQEPTERRGRRRLPFGRRRPGTAHTGSTEPAAGHLPFTPRAKKALELSLREAIALKDRHIGVEHVVLGLLRSDDRVTLAVLGRLGLDPRPTRDILLTDLRKAA